MTFEQILISGEYDGTKEFFKEAVGVIYAHKDEFDNYFKSGIRLAGVKALKDYTNGGLKDCKNICELYWQGKISNLVRDDRRKKLERLARQPFAEELAKKIKDIDELDLLSRLMKFEMDDLFLLDDLFSEKLNK